MLTPACPASPGQTEMPGRPGTAWTWPCSLKFHMYPYSKAVSLRQTGGGGSVLLTRSSASSLIPGGRSPGSGTATFGAQPAWRARAGAHLHHGDVSVQHGERQ